MENLNSTLTELDLNELETIDGGGPVTVGTVLIIAAAGVVGVGVGAGVVVGINKLFTKWGV